MKVLVTGGAGYIGSHTCIVLLDAGYEVAILDNFSNSEPSVVRRIEKISGKKVSLFDIELRDREAVEACFRKVQPDAVVHFAGLKVVSDSIEYPLKYYEGNVVASVILFQVMQACRVKNIIFSSSANVYGDATTVPINEAVSLSPTNPYGSSKLMIEKILQDVAHSDSSWGAVCLRYFNPVGAHPSGLIGEKSLGTPSNLLPYIADVAIGQQPSVRIFGNDYDTHDGTGVRDYIHVMDLAQGHVAALKYLERKCGCTAFNLGTGRGYSVLEMLSSFEKACGHAIPYQFYPRREGDVAQSFADCSLSKSELAWEAQLGIDSMCQDTWRWRCCLADMDGE